MNQSLLIMADYVPSDLQGTQTIGKEDIDLENLFKLSCKHSSPKTYLYVNSDFEQLFKKKLQKVKSIKAAGGVVKNGNGDYLFIYRLGKWDLPKGKLEDGEKIKEAAVREVEEECGVKVDYLGKKLMTTYHTYQMRGEFVLKQTHWYEMAVNKAPALKPQEEEDITKAEWLSKDVFLKLSKKTYPLILDVMETV